jgi:tetratricopeptide (TPR) repeat protein
LVKQGTASRRLPAEDRTQHIGELLVVHRTKVIAALIVVVLLLGGGWFYRRSVAIKHERAETAYFRARAAMDQGNLALAETDLRTVVTRYQGTPGGTQAAIALAEVLYMTGKPADGIAVLRDAEPGAPDYLRAEVRRLIGAGHENLGQFLEAAREFERAAEVARFPQDRAAYRAAAGRAYMAAGRNTEALAIWRELEDDPSEVEAFEARVRIGEILATPAAGS